MIEDFNPHLDAAELEECSHRKERWFDLKVGRNGHCRRYTSSKTWSPKALEAHQITFASKINEETMDGFTNTKKNRLLSTCSKVRQPRNSLLPSSQDPAGLSQPSQSKPPIHRNNAFTFDASGLNTTRLVLSASDSYRKSAIYLQRD